MRVIKILALFIVFILLGGVLEILFMSVLAKLGVAHLDMETRGESVKEIVQGIVLFYYYPTKIYTVPLYLVSATVITSFYYRNKEISMKGGSVINFVLSLILFLILWFVFDNSVSLILNPLLGILLANGVLFLLFRRLQLTIK